MTMTAPFTPGSGTELGVTTDWRTCAYDPHTFETWRWAMAPTGLATRRQLAARRLAPTGDPVGRITWRRGRKVAYLYDAATARPKAPFTEARRRALAAAKRARSTCRACGGVWTCALGADRTCPDCLHGPDPTDPKETR